MKALHLLTGVQDALRAVIDPVRRALDPSELQAAGDELARIQVLPPKVRRHIERLTAYCPAGSKSGHPVVVVYATTGRLLLHLVGTVKLDLENDEMPIDDLWGRGAKPGAVIRPHPARWLRPGSSEVWTVECWHGVHSVGAAELLDRLPGSARRTVAAADLGPTAGMP